MPVFGFLARCSPKVFYRLKKDGQSLSFQLVQRVWGESVRGEKRKKLLGLPAGEFLKKGALPPCILRA